MSSSGPTKAEYEELVKDLKPTDIIGNFKVTRFSNALEVSVCTMKLQRNFEFRYMIHYSSDEVMEEWMNWSDISAGSTSTDGFTQRMTLEQMGKCIEHRKKWLLGSIFADE